MREIYQSVHIHLVLVRCGRVGVCYIVGYTSRLDWGVW